jgi:gentisate 1,2-dioxygenase
MRMTANRPNDLTRQREELYQELASRSIGPLWRALATAAPTSPVVESGPQLWRWRYFRTAVLDLARA